MNNTTDKRKHYQRDSDWLFSLFFVIPITRNIKPIVRNIIPDVRDEWLKYALEIMITAASSITRADVNNIILAFFI